MAVTTPCIEWPHATSAQGYGVFRSDGKTRYAHRDAWSKHTGLPIPNGMVIRHSCDNRKCVNPGHLELGTYGDNANDCARRNRHQNKKLSDASVIQIKRYLEDPYPGIGRNLAAIYGVSEHLISKIKCGINRRRG